MTATPEAQVSSEYACTVCDGWGIVQHGGYYVPGDQFCEPPGEDRCEACIGSGQRDVQHLVDEAERLRARVAELEAVTEWAAKWSDGGYAPACPPRNEEWVRWHARVMGTKPIRRHVGPWVYADTGEVVWP